jgi:prophage tail gpP-like protein
MQDGVIWKPNTLVAVQSAYLGIDQDLLIAKCIYTKDDKGTFTELQLVHPSAFDILTGVKGTGLNRKITGANGLEDNRKRAKNKAKGTGDGVIVEFATGTPGSGGAK